MSAAGEPIPVSEAIIVQGRAKGYTEDQRTELIRQVYLMRTLRIGVNEIAHQFNISAQTVGLWVREAIDRNLALDNLTDEQARRLEWDTLDQLTAQLQPGVDAGQIGAIDQARRLSESRRKLRGLDAPEAHDVRMAVRSYVGVDMDEV